MIPYKRFTTEESAFYCDIILKCNKNLARLEKLLNCKSRIEIRQKLFRSNSCSLANFKELSFEKKATLAKAFPAIQKARDIEIKVIAAVSAFANKMSFWAYRITTIPVEDCYSEAVLAILDGMYSYDGSIKLTSYLFKCIKNRIRKLMRCNSLLSPLTNEIIKMQYLFEQEKVKLNRPCQEEEIFAILKWNNREISRFKKSRVSCVVASTLSHEDMDDDDYSTLGKRFHKDTSESSYETKTILSDMSPLDKEILEYYMCPTVGWQTALAKKHSCVRATISFRLKTLLKNLKNTYKEAA